MSQTSLPEVPRYRELMEALRRQIVAGDLSHGARLPSFADMRAKEGISRATMEQAYAGLEQEGLVERRRGSGVYVAQPVRKPLRNVLGLAVGGEDDGLSYYSPLVEGIRDVARREGQELMLLDDMSSLGKANFDGVVMQGTGAASLSRLLPPGIPSVALMVSGHVVPAVLADDFGGARQATEHLLELGHRRIGYLIDIQESGEITRRRFDGYRAALHDWDVPHDGHWLHHLHNYGAMFYRGYFSMREWLEGNWRKLGCTALLVQNDRAALGAMQALQQVGIAVPRDVSVVGFDGTNECEFAMPHLTSVEVPLRRIGAEAAELLLESIRSEKIGAPDRMLPTELKIRDSTQRLTIDNGFVA